MPDLVFPDSLQAYFDSLTPTQKAENARWAVDRLAELQRIDAAGHEGLTSPDGEADAAIDRQAATG